MKEVVKWLKEIAYLLYLIEFGSRVGDRAGRTFKLTPHSKSSYLKGIK